MDLAAQIEALATMIAQAKAMPLSSSVLVHRDQVLAAIEEMRQTLPEEIRQARTVVRDREELLAKARLTAQQIITRAEQEQLRMAQHEEIVVRAHGEAQRVLAQAQDEARGMRDGAAAYSQDRLAQLEGILQEARASLGALDAGLASTLDQVGAGRHRLQGTEPAPSTASATATGPFDEGDLGP